MLLSIYHLFIFFYIILTIHIFCFIIFSRNSAAEWLYINRYNYRLITQMHWSSSFSISHLNKCATIIQRNWRGFLGRDLTRVLVRVGTDFYKLNFYKSTLSSQCMLSINILTNTCIIHVCIYTLYTGKYLICRLIFATFTPIVNRRILHWQLFLLYVF